MVSNQFRPTNFRPIFCYIYPCVWWCSVVVLSQMAISVNHRWWSEWAGIRELFADSQCHFNKKRRVLHSILLVLGIVDMNFNFCSLNMRACFTFGVSWFHLLQLSEKSQIKTTTTTPILISIKPIWLIKGKYMNYYYRGIILKKGSFHFGV